MKNICQDFSVTVTRVDYTMQIIII